MSTVSALTFADHLLPRRDSRSLGRNIALVIGGSLLIALSARISIPVGFGLVPITGQTFAVLLVGALLGGRLGALAVIAYIGEGLAGLPVAALGPAGIPSGIPWLLGPTGGYLVGFIAAAYITGTLAQRGWDRNPLLTVAAMSLGTIAIFLPGVVWLAIQAKVISMLALSNIRLASAENVLMAGLWPFLPGAVIKIGLAAALLPSGWKLLAMFGNRNPPLQRP